MHTNYLFTLLFLLSLLSTKLSGQDGVLRSSSDEIDREFVVALENGYNLNDLSKIVTEFRSDLHITRKISQGEHLYLLTIENAADRTLAIENLRSNPAFAIIFKNEPIEIRRKPDDPKFELQWTMDKIGMDKAWEHTTGGTTAQGDEIVVAVVDDGFDMDHEDLIANFYNNPHDQAGDMNNDGCPGDCGVDDDGDGLVDEDFFGRVPGDPQYDPSYAADDDENGYKDDTQGLNPKTGTDDHPYKSHGSSVAGIMGAKGDNAVGVAGISWNVKILPISEGLSVANVIESYNYLTDLRRRYNETDGEQGAFIVTCNFSAGISNAFPDEYRTWCDMYDIMGEQGILNVVAVPNDNVNIDQDGDIPSLCESKYLIAVTSTDQSDNLAEAGFGSENVDIAAPGEESYTVDPILSSGYGSFPGTSAASPHVAGAIGLLYSIPCENFVDYFKKNPSKVDSLASIILESADVLENMRGLTKSEARLNVFNTMVDLSLFCGGSDGNVEIVKLYPNPVVDQLLFEFIADPREEIYLEIYNILGQKVSSKLINYPLYEKPELSVNTSDLNTGIYFLSLSQGKQRVALKFYKT